MPLVQSRLLGLDTFEIVSELRIVGPFGLELAQQSSQRSLRSGQRGELSHLFTTPHDPKGLAAITYPIQEI